MGEIKSTMDMVMEKTRHMTLSREEKEAQKMEEVSKSLKGLVVRYQDGILTMERLEEELKKVETSHSVSAGPLLEKEILDRIDLSGDNSALLSLLERVCRTDTRRLEKILSEYNDAVTDLEGRYATESKDRIYRKWRVSGSAVVPDLKDRTDFSEQIQSVKKAYLHKIVQEFEFPAHNF